MKEPGQVVLLRFPQADLTEGKLRPALLVAKLPGEYDDWLILMISSRIHQALSDFDEVIRDTDADYAESGLKTTSLIRLSRLAVVEGSILLGAIGHISPDRLQRIKSRLAAWLLGT